MCLLIQKDFVYCPISIVFYQSINYESFQRLCHDQAVKDKDASLPDHDGSDCDKHLSNG